MHTTLERRGNSAAAGRKIDRGRKGIEPSRTPGAPLRTIDAVALIIGIVVGAGIFRTPSVVAANVSGEFWLLCLWGFGGIVSLTGALCYAELCTAFPSRGGEYYFLKTAFGRGFSFLYAWSRITVIQTGSIAMLAYIAGDYMARLFPIGDFSAAIYATAVVVILTLVNVSGIHLGTALQKLLTALQFTGIAIIISVGLSLPSASLPISIPAAESTPEFSSIGLALLFVLLSFGGWNEAAYISSELKSGSKNIVKVLVSAILFITLLYLMINMVFLKVLGLKVMAASDAVGVEMMKVTLGDKGVILIGMLVTLSALTSLNTTIFTGSRSSYALGRDYNQLAFLGEWSGKRSAPVNALYLQGTVAVLLILFGAFTRSGFEAMVDFTAPVFWFFFMSIGLALIVLRHKRPDNSRPFSVPLYPVTPLLFIIVCGYLFYSSLSYTGNGALLGVALLLAGLLFYLTCSRK